LIGFEVPVVVDAGKVVVLHYRLSDSEGRHLEDTRCSAPLSYLHGNDNIVPGLERALTGLAAGARLRVTVPAEEGYGHRKGPGPQPVPRRMLGRHRELRIGTELEVEASDGTKVRVWVVAERGATVWIDVDHPLAGTTLTYEVEVLEIRGPTAFEVAAGDAGGRGGRRPVQEGHPRAGRRHGDGPPVRDDSAAPMGPPSGLRGAP
jgi:FKBP-type peptidyl-prolyl cis-trans isomerase SlyD